MVPMRASSSSSRARSRRRRSSGSADAARLLDLAAKAELHLAGRLLGEGHRDDPVERAGTRPDQTDDPADQRGGLAGARRRLDEEGRPELGQDAAPGFGVGELVMAGSEAPRSGSSASRGFRAVRCSS